MSKILLGIFSDRVKAENVVTELEAQGYDLKDISVIVRDHQPTRANATFYEEQSMAEGAASGVATGGLIGGLAGLLVGIRAIAIPGIGGLLIVGPLSVALGLTEIAAATMSGAVTGAVAGGLVGGLIGLGIPEEEAKVIEGRIKEGGVLVAVPVLVEHESQVRNIFHQFHVDMIRVIPSMEEKEIDDHQIEGNEAAFSDEDNAEPAEVRFPSPAAYRPGMVDPEDPSKINQVYYSDVRTFHKMTKPTFWQKLKNLFS